MTLLLYLHDREGAGGPTTICTVTRGTLTLTTITKGTLDPTELGSCSAIPGSPHAYPGMMYPGDSGCSVYALSTITKGSIGPTTITKGSLAIGTVTRGTLVCGD